MSSGANFEPSRFMQQKGRSGESVFVDCLSETKGAIDAAEVAGIPLRNTDYLGMIAYKIAFYFFKEVMLNFKRVYALAEQILLGGIIDHNYAAGERCRRENMIEGAFCTFFAC